jgi:hypothetical protein
MFGQNKAQSNKNRLLNLIGKSLAVMKGEKHERKGRWFV